MGFSDQASGFSPRRVEDARPRRRRSASPVLEGLEGRRLLSGAHAGPHPRGLVHADAAPAEVRHDRAPRLQAAGHRRHHKPLRGYAGPSLPRLSQGSNLRYFQEMQAEHNAAVALLKEALGPAARPKPEFKDIQAPNASALLGLARTLEETGFRTAEAAAPYFADRTLIAKTGLFAFAEAEHAGYLNVLSNLPLSPSDGPFAEPLSPEVAVARAQPFIEDLNGGPTPGFEKEVSPANDVAILNTALLLEYLAADFYNTNVPLYQGVLANTPFPSHPRAHG